MDDLLNLQKQKNEFKVDERVSVKEEQKLRLQDPQEMEQAADEVDDLYFECNNKELEERLNRVPEDPDANVAAEIQRAKTEYHVLDLAMMEKTRNAIAPDPDAVAPDNTLLKEEKKSEVPVNVIDMKSAEKNLDLNKLEEGEKQQERQQEQRQEQQNVQPVQEVKEQKAPVNRSLPEALKETLQSIINDKRSASKYYSDVKAAAAKVLALDLNDLKKAKEVYASMAELMNVAILYRDKRSGNRFLKKGKERAAWMDALIGGMSEFATEDPVYMYRITENWQNELMDDKGYPAHLSKWMKKETQKWPGSEDKSEDPVSSEYAYIYSVIKKYDKAHKNAADSFGWVDATQKTNNQATRISPTLSMTLFVDVHSDGSAADEEAAEVFSQQEEKIKLIQSTVPAERAKVLNPLIQKYLDMKITPEMLTPSYITRHMHEWSELSHTITLYDNIFVSDKINAAYLETLPENVKKKLEVFTDFVARFGVAQALISTSLGMGLHGERVYDDRVPQALSEEKEYAAVVKQFTDYTSGKVKAAPRIKEYKKGMHIEKGVTYFAEQPIEGMPKNTIIPKETVSLIALRTFESLCSKPKAYKQFLTEKIDLDAEMQKTGPLVNDELIKDVELPADCQSVVSAKNLTAFWENTVKEIGAEQEHDNERVLFQIQIKKDLGIRNEKLHKVLYSNQELTREQIAGIEEEINANMRLILESTKEIDSTMESLVTQKARMTYFEAHKEEGRAAKPGADAAGKTALEEFKKKREEAFIPPEETEMKEEHDRKVGVLVARLKQQNPGFDEKWGELIYNNANRVASVKLGYLDKDKKDILGQYGKECASQNVTGQLQRDIWGPVLRRVNYTPGGEFATKKDRETYLNNRRILDALAQKNDEVLKEEIKKYLYETFERLSELSEEIADPEYYIKNPHKLEDAAYALYYSNVKISSIPAVHEAYEEFKKEQPEALRWMDKRLGVEEFGFVSINFPMNGYNEGGTSYLDRFPMQVTAEEQREYIKSQEQEIVGLIKDALKTKEKKPGLLKFRNEEELESLKTNAKALHVSAEKVANDNALLRMNCPMEVKAQCGYEAVKNLSSFRDIFDGDASAMFTELLKKYGSDENSEGRKEVLDTLTKRILSYDPASFGDLSDDEVVKNAESLEKLSREIVSYRALLWQNAGYTDKLMEEDAESFAHLQEHCAKLSAISDYYRVRKMILTDSQYTESKLEIAENAYESDTKSTLHLKEMIALSKTLLERAKSAGEVDEKQMLETEKKIHALELANLSSNSYQERKHLSLSTPPREVLAPSAAAIGFGAQIVKIVNLMDYKNKVQPDYNEKKEQLRREKFQPNDENKVNNSFDAEFKNAKLYKGLGQFGVADNLARMTEKMLFMAKTMGMSTEDENEWYLNLSVMKTKDYNANKDDKKAMSYMEEAFADACMKSLVLHNAIFEKLAETLGQDVFMMHQEDLIERLTEEEIAIMNVASTITNIVLPGGLKNTDNKALVDFVNDYKAKHPFADAIDAEKFVAVATAYSTIYFKMALGQNTGTYLKIQAGKEKIDPDDNYDFEKYKNGIKDNLTEEEVTQWFEAHKDEPKIKEYILKAGISYEDYGSIVGLYLYMHPEKVKKEFLKVTCDKEANITAGSYATGTCPEMVDLARYGIFKPHSVKELKEYEKSLKERNMNAQRIIDAKRYGMEVSESDPYQLHDQYAMIVAYVEGKEERNEPVTDEEKQEVALAKAQMQRIKEAEDAQLEKMKRKYEER